MYIRPLYLHSAILSVIPRAAADLFISLGIYKSEDKHLFELTLTDIEQIYASQKKSKSSYN
ncbi:Fur-regulated basic protein FbpA [Halalkalibacter alkalisediminis]|uniref:Fur-regulated basic protein FbpA n=1 Tax=Halalkalibacter alkalisediminis TaxID=935616 RepID=UPI00363F5937